MMFGRIGKVLLFCPDGIKRSRASLTPLVRGGIFVMLFKRGLVDEGPIAGVADDDAHGGCRFGRCERVEFLCEVEKSIGVDFWNFETRSLLLILFAPVGSIEASGRPAAWKAVAPPEGTATSRHHGVQMPSYAYKHVSIRRPVIYPFVRDIH